MYIDWYINIDLICAHELDQIEYIYNLYILDLSINVLFDQFVSRLVDLDFFVIHKETNILLMIKLIEIHVPICSGIFLEGQEMKLNTKYFLIILL